MYVSDEHLRRELFEGGAGRRRHLPARPLIRRAVPQQKRTCGGWEWRLQRPQHFLTPGLCSTKLLLPLP